MPSIQAIPAASSPHSTGQALGKLISDNAKERRKRYRELKEEGKADQVAIWPSTDQAASSSTNQADIAGQNGATRAGDAAEQKTAHLLLRVLGLTFVAPLMDIGPQGDPANVVRREVTPAQALDTIESMITEKTAVLDHVFDSSPAQGSSSQSTNVLASTTLDIWLGPRMLVAAAVLTLRSCELLSAPDSTSEQEPATTSPSSFSSQQQSAIDLRQSLLSKLKTILKLSISKVNHLETVRALLDEMIFASVQALAYSGVDPPSCIQRDVIRPGELDTDAEGPYPFITVFSNGLADGQCLSTTSSSQSPSGEGIGRLWMPEDHTNFSVSLSQQEHTRHFLRTLGQAMLCLTVGVILALTRTYPIYLLDIAQIAVKALLSDWQRDMDFRHTKLPPEQSPDVIAQLRFGAATQMLASSDIRQWNFNNVSTLLATEYAERMQSYNADLPSSPQDARIWQSLHTAVKALRQSRHGCRPEAWTTFHRLLPESIHTLFDQDEDHAIQHQNGSSTATTPNVSLLRKRTALEAVFVVLKFSVTPYVLNATQVRDLTTTLALGSTSANETEMAESHQSQHLHHPWLDDADIAEASALLNQNTQLRATRKGQKRKRHGDEQTRTISEEDLLADIKTGGKTPWSGDDGFQVDAIQIRATGLQICASAGQLGDRSETQNDNLGLLSRYFCLVCDDDNACTTRPAESSKVASLPSVTAARVVARLSPAHSVASLEYARRLVNHESYDAFMDSDEAIAQFLASGISHATRDVRLAASRLAHAVAAKHCAHVEPSSSLLRSRLQSLLSTHKTLLSEGSAKVQETVIISLGRLGHINREEVLEQVLLQLVLQLNGRILLRSCAYLQITQLAAFHKCSVYALLSPHFDVISPPIVERMTSAPNLFLEVLSLTNQNQAKFLQATLPFTLPSIIASQKSKVLDLIVGALDTNVPKLCLDQAPAILKNYLLLPGKQRDRNLQIYLDTIRKSSAQDVPLKGLYRSYVGEILGHLVACLGDPNRRAMAVEGLRHIESVLSADKADRKSKAISGGDLSAFLREEILGILAWLNDDLMSVNGKKSPSFKAMVARSIGVFIEVVGSTISTVAPQIMATLSSTLQVPELRLATLHSWRIFMTTLRFDDVGPFIGQTTAALLSEWTGLTRTEKQVAKEILSYLIVENAQEMQKYINEIPNMEDISSELPEACRKLRSSRQNWSPEQQLTQILDRVADENVSISLRSLRELKAFITKHREYVAQQTSGTAFAPVVATMISALLSSIRRSDETQQELQDLCLESLGMIGAVDPDRLNLANEDSPHKLLQNFQDRDETIDFVVHLIRDILVSAFRATSDTKHQSALAYAIQELLKFCGFTSILLRPGSRSIPVKIKQRWCDLPGPVIDTIAPLLDSKYSITHGPATEYPRPFYHHSNSYREWIEMWANHLMQGATGQDAETIFGIFRVLIRHHDLDVTQHILPHAVLHNLISGSDTRREELRQEFVAVLTDQVDPKMGYSADRRLLCAQTVFALMDHMSAWLRLKRLQQSKQQSRQRRENQQDDSVVNVESVIASISQELMARASLYCRAYARSLLNFEQRIRDLRSSGKSNNDLQSYYENLHSIYANLDEPDGMEGISTCIISPSLEHQIREHESTGRWTSAQSCWEVQIQASPDEPANHVGLLQCLRSLGHYDTMRTHVRGALALNPQWENLLAPFAIEGACIMGDWEEAQQAIKRRGLTGSSESAVARMLLALAGRSAEPFEEVLRDARRSLGQPILAAGRDSYPQIYESVLHLHMVHEISLIKEMTRGTSRSARDLSQLMKVLQARFNSTLPAFRFREPLLSVRRSAFTAQRDAEAATESSYQAEVADAWISTCKTARKAGFTQTAYSAILQAMVNQAPFAFVQRAKLLQANEQIHVAMQELRNSIQAMSANVQLPTTGTTTGASSVTTANESNVIDLSSDIEVDRHSLAKAMILEANLRVGTERYNPNDIIEAYRFAARMDARSEKAWFALGDYYDTVRKTMNLGNQSTQDHNVCRYFVKCAQLGTKYFYRSVPRMLTIWLDLGHDELILKMAAKNTIDRKARPDDFEKVDNFARMNDLMIRASVKLQPYQWLAVFPQLFSRIAHKHEKVWQILRDIIASVLLAYPHQAMWGMVAGFQSTDAHRKKRANAIVEKAKSGKTSKETIKIIDASQQLAHHLLVLCEQNFGKTVTTVTMESSFPELFALAKGDLILPLQSSVTVNLPANYEIKVDHSPFPADPPRLVGFESTIEIMNSLQRPKKIVMLGSDGKRYAFLCKPKDDLRKDARLMDFDSMINKLLQRDSNSRRRHLLIRTYAVVTLNEECGLIEWVPNTIGLRHILAKLYQSRGIPLYSQDIKTVTDECRKVAENRAAQLFESKVLTRYPPVFHEWFLNTFPEPASWLRARLSYSRTAAVMSIVGHVLGLGDRHGENMLFDSVSGDTVHVDFNCLFEKGMTFEIPEVVPFRLTRNMTDAMGVTGYEGVFRRAAEITMSILINNKASLMTVLHAMVHDPLVEWGVGGGQRSKSSSSRASSHAQAMNSLEPVDKKLSGWRRKDVKSREWEHPRSTNDLVDSLIRDATSNGKLSQLYIGWCAWA
ncbi:unnamed protein product [Sympodiomycopsis kandeliae]